MCFVLGGDLTNVYVRLPVGELDSPGVVEAGVAFSL